MVEFGKRTAAPTPPPRKRSQGVHLRVMAGAGAAALGVYALAPNASCPEGRLYDSLEQCLSHGALSEAICRSGFDRPVGPARDPVLFSGPNGSSAQVALRTDGGFRLRDGTFLSGDAVCRPYQSRTSSTSWGSSRGSNWFSSGSSSSGSGDHAATTTSRGGFGGIGHAFSSGGG
ncbi:hypothetical protein [Alsobacter sp. R-9]